MSESTDQTQTGGVNYTILGSVEPQKNLAISDLSTQAAPPPLSVTDTDMATSNSMRVANEKEEMSQRLEMVCGLQKPHHSDAVAQPDPELSKDLPATESKGPTIDEVAKEAEIRSNSYDAGAMAQPKGNVPLDPDLDSIKSTSPRGSDLKLQDTDILVEERRGKNRASASLTDSTTSTSDLNLKLQTASS